MLAVASTPLRTVSEMLVPARTAMQAALPLYPRGPRSGPGFAVPVHCHLFDPIRPTGRHIAISLPFGLGSVSIVIVPITIPLLGLAGLDHLRLIHSPSEYLAMVQLSGIANTGTSPTRLGNQQPRLDPRYADPRSLRATLEGHPVSLAAGPNPPDVRVIAGDTYHYGGTFWGGSENPLIVPTVNPFG